MGSLGAAFVILLAPFAAATSYSPPWASSSLAGPYTHVYLQAFYNIYKFDATASTGVAHSDTDSWVWLPGGGFGDAYVITYASFGSSQFTGPSNDYYNFYWNWKLNGNAELDNYIVPGGGATVTTYASIYLIGWIYDVTKGVSLPPFTLTILNAQNTVLVWVMNWNFNNFGYQLSTSSPYGLYAGHQYVLTAQLKGYDEANGGGIAAGGFAFGHVNLTATFYQWSYTLWTGGGCVLSGTQVLTHGNETRSVDSLKPGQTIVGWDTMERRFVNETVLNNTASFVTQVDSINNGQLLVTTSDQPLYVRNGTWQGWIQNPNDLTAGEQLFQPATGRWLNITSIQLMSGNFKVYDLRVTAAKDFIANGLLAGDK